MKWMKKVAEPQEIEEQQEGSELASATNEELEELLQEAIRHEDYERASEIRDEINKRN